MSEQQIFMQSNAIRGEYMQNIMDRTINEIHDDMKTIFGPHAQDAFITKDGMPYFTRDGKETISSLRFDNPLAIYILKIFYQAVYDQAKEVGDGTTTLAMLYTNIYKTLRESEVYVDRKAWNEYVGKLVAKIKEYAHPMSDDDMKQMLLTCTQDAELSSKIYRNLKDPIKNGAYITINKSNIQTDFQMDVQGSPMIKATIQFSIRPFKSEEPRCVVLHCNGVLDIAHPEVILDIISRIPTYGVNGDVLVPKTIVVLCNGLTEATRRTVKTVIRRLNDNKIEVENFNNFVIMTLDEYRSYSNEQLEDISTVITDEMGIGGLVNQLTFESLLYQAFHNPTVKIPELETFDCDTHHINRIRELMDAEPYAITYDAVHGIRIDKPLGPVAKARYDELRKQIDEEKSDVARIALQRRLKTSYGQFIDVKVGSKLLKDSQLKYELIVDAVLSASEAVECGVLNTNSLLVALKVIEDNAITTETDNMTEDVEGILVDAISQTIIDMVDNGWNVNLRDAHGVYMWMMGKDLSKFDLTRSNWFEVLPAMDDDVEVKKYTVKGVDGAEDITFEGRIVEPVSTITRMLENSALVIDLYNAKTFHLEQFIQNYI